MSDDTIELIARFAQLIWECEEHNRAYEHVTSEERLLGAKRLLEKVQGKTDLVTPPTVQHMG